MKSLSIVLAGSIILLSNTLNASSQVDVLNQEKISADSIPAQASNQEAPAVVTELNSLIMNEEIMKSLEISPAYVGEQGGAVVEPVSREVSSPVVNAESASSGGKSNLVPVDHSFFNKMKSLAGRWDGTAKNEANQPEDKIAVIYEVTAGGNAVLERLFPGTKQEMVTLYYENKGMLMLTHYSILGNRPMMQLKEGQENVFEFEFIPNPDLNPVVDTHMNSLKIAFIDENHINQVWMMFEGGKPAGSYSFQLTRVLTGQPQ